MIIILECYTCGHQYKISIYDKCIYISSIGKLLNKKQLIDKKKTQKYKCIYCNENQNFLILKDIN